MRLLRSFSLAQVSRALPGCLALLCATLLFGSLALHAQGYGSAARIVDRIDEGRLVTLKGNTHPAANAKNDLGPVDSTLPMTDLILVLSRSAEQQAAFDKFVASQYDPTSSNYHQWLQPAEVGTKFGANEADIATVSNWLTGHGFAVTEVTKDHLSIRFSGTAGQVESTFHTEIHNLSVKGKAHIGNMSDPQIPAALAPAVVGVKALHNFFPRPAHHMGSQVTRDNATGKWTRLESLRPSLAGVTANASPLKEKALASPKSTTTSPLFGISGSSEGYSYQVEDVDPWDFATIYNILPLWNKSGSAVDGTGQAIAIAGTSDIDVGQSTAESGANGNNDVQTFRSYFGLPTNNAANTPIRISGNSKPLTVCTDTTGNIPYPDNPCGIDDLTENSLDVEWSGSVAKNAQIILVSSYPTSVSDDNLYDSESYIVNHLTAHIMNVSYGECELGMGTAGNVEYYDLWQQAAAEGIAVFVAAGDSGSASCDDGGLVAESGLTVSGLASTPWNTAVGGTDFNWCSAATGNNWSGSTPSGSTVCTASPYWGTAYTSTGSTQPVTTALGYVPETPWNESCTNPLTLSWVQDAANYHYSIPTSGSNGITNTEQSCNFLLDYDFNSYEGYTGLGLEYPYLLNLLETVGGSGGASNCVVGNAVENSTTGEITGCSNGATSTGATTNPDTGASQASLTLYNNGWPKPSWQQSSKNNIPGLPSDGVRDLPDVSFFASDGFVSSSAYLMCASANNAGNAPCTYSAYAESFYQEVGGTSVATPAMAGVMALVNQKTGASQGFANPELYSLAATQTYSNCKAESVTAGSTVCMFNDIDQGTNAMPCDDGIYSTTSATYSTPNCVASYSTFGYADSDQGLGILTGYGATTGYDQATGLGSLNIANVVNNWVSNIGTDTTSVTVAPTPNPVSESQSLSVVVTVASTTSSVTTTPTGTVTLSGGGYSSSAETLSGGAYTFTIPAGSLSGGTDTLTAIYSGDANYAQNTGSAPETVNKLTATVSATPSSPAINSNTTLIVTGTVTGSGATPTGTVYVAYGTTYASSPAPVTSGSYSVTVTPNSLPGGTDALTVVYSGDANYSAANGSTSVIVTYVPVINPTMTVTPAMNPVDSGSPLLVTVSLSGANGTPTGTVTLQGSGFTTYNGTTPPTANLTGGVAQFTIPANTLTSNSKTPSSDTLTANYLGDPDYNQVVQTATVTVVQSAYSLAATSIANLTPGATTGNTSAVSVISPTDYSGTVTFTTANCVLTGYPTGVTSATSGNPTCALSGSGTVTMTDGVASGPATYAISTTSTTTALLEAKPGMGRGWADTQLAKTSLPTKPQHARSNGTGWFGAAGGTVIAALFLFLVPGGSRRWRQMLGMILLIAAATFTSVGCGGGSATTPTLGTPTVTVTTTPSSVTLGSSTSVAIQVTVTGTSGTPTGSVSVSGGGYSSTSAALSAGTYTFSVPASSFTSVGSDTLTAIYSGDSNYNSATGTSTITVNNVPTTAGTYTFTVTPSSNPAMTVQPSATFTVTVVN